MELDLPAPSYALGTRDGLVVRSGEHEVLLPEAKRGAFLPDGDVLVDVAQQDVQRRFRVLDPASGTLSGDVRTEGSGDPGRPVTRVNLRQRSGEHVRLQPYDLDLRHLPSVDLPVTDDPEATDDDALARGYYGVAATTGEETALVGELAASRGLRYVTGSVPGQLLPPE